MGDGFGDRLERVLRSLEDPQVLKRLRIPDEFPQIMKHVCSIRSGTDYSDDEKQVMGFALGEFFAVCYVIGAFGDPRGPKWRKLKPEMKRRGTSMLNALIARWAAGGSLHPFIRAQLAAGLESGDIKLIVKRRRGRPRAQVGPVVDAMRHRKDPLRKMAEDAVGRPRGIGPRRVRQIVRMAKKEIK
jgi:hypothetical protein